MAGNIGYVLRIHDTTLAMTDTSEALVCIEMDLNSPRRERIWIGIEDGGFWQPISYHRVPHLCSFCHKIGHMENQCKKKLRDASVRPAEGIDQIGSTQKTRQVYRPRDVPFVGKPAVEVHNRFSSLSDGSENVSTALSVTVQEREKGKSMVIQPLPQADCGEDTEASPSISLIRQDCMEQSDNNILSFSKCEGKYSGKENYSSVSSLSQKENSRMMLQDNASQVLSQSHAPTEECIAPGVLFSDIRLTRAKAKAIAPHSTLPIIDE